MSITPAALVDHYQQIADERMRGLPVFNPRLNVEALGFCDVAGDSIGVLITPWFMNLVLLPGTDNREIPPQGSDITIGLPAGDVAMTVCSDELGVYMTSVLFRTVVDFPDPDLARQIGAAVLDALFGPPMQRNAADGVATGISRRDLFASLRSA